MKRFAFLLSVLCLFATLNINAQTCTPTGFVRDGINMTAAVINPATAVTGQVNATGCNIGVYIDGIDATIDNAEIFGANYFGIVVNGDLGSPSASITNSNIHDIGETPLNGTQHGVAIYFRSFSLTGSASGTVSNDTVTNYQKGGIVVVGQGVNVAVTDNVVTGQGPVTYIAQNGIEVGYGASASVMRNTVTGNAYSGTNNASSGGIIVVGGAGYGTCPDGNPCPYSVNTRIIQNTVRESDVGVWLSNADASFNPPTSATNIKVVNNVLSKSTVTNISGCGSPLFYQAGVSDEGNNDKIVTNSISGAGYANANTLGCGTFSIDATFAARSKVHANTVTP
jgi:parallel beta helix pectate lyase-like protein